MATPVELWEEALLSGEYKQGIGLLCEVDKRLNNKFSFCCLGVLCEVYQKHVGGLTIEDKDVIKLNNVNFKCRSYNGETEELPDVVRKWAELNDPDGSYYPSKSLAADNDGLQSFSDIAETIKARPPELFVRL